jgi:hypothetical protein
MIRAAFAVIATSALVALNTVLSAQTTGVAACDFLKKYETCVTSRIPGFGPRRRRPARRPGYAQTDIETAR